MKFNQTLQDSIYEEWRYFYIDYDGLKRQLKVDGSTKFSEQQEADFLNALEAELEKVHNFRKIKADELDRRIKSIETRLHKLVESKSPATDSAVQMTSVKDAAEKITVEVGELSKYTRTNFTGFLKILKKHDKYTTYQLKPMFMVRLKQKAFYKESVDKLLVRLAKIFDTVRTGKENPEVLYGAERSGRIQSNFVRSTKKYLVRVDDVDEVKIMILKHLPVYYVNSKGGGEDYPHISSVYLDNENFDLYTSRLERKDGGEAIRLRWYGNLDQNEIFVERKVHHDESSSVASIKSRFPIKEKYVNSFLSGEYTVDRVVQKAAERMHNKSEVELHALEDLATDIQKKIKTMSLKPIMRTFYNRIAFQLPGDSSVRISLDTDLNFIREDNKGTSRSKNDWRRTDAGVTAPFDYLPKEDVHIFDKAILEIKLEDDSRTPSWVEELTRSNLLHEVNRFSKFVHGVAVLRESEVSLLPYWLPLVHSIPASAPVAPRRNTSTPSLISMEPRRNNAVTDEITVVVDNDNGVRSRKPTPSVSSALSARPGAASDERTPLLGSVTANAAAANSSPSAPLSATSWWSWIASAASVRAGNSPQNPAAQRQSTVLLGPDGRPLPANKRVALPVRVEPKVFFANERTFLSWLHFCIVLGGLAVGLLNFGDRVGQISGVLFTMVAMMFMIYSLFLYQWRAQKIRDRHPGPYDDRVGPTILVFVLFAAVSVNFWLKFSDPTSLLWT